MLSTCNTYTVKRKINEYLQYYRCVWRSNVLHNEAKPEKHYWSGSLYKLWKHVNINIGEQYFIKFYIFIFDVCVNIYHSLMDHVHYAN